ncbi:MAG: stage II sporulation protein M [Nanoarchaeota archaeon]|nr:stage II sporulation protein M [Nanoarchaeota archaeon]
MKKKFLKENYIKCGKFFGECRWHVVFALATFALLFIIGFAFPIFFREEIFNFIVEMTEMIEGRTILELIGIIFFNNLRASFFAMIFGIGFGVFPLIVGIVNGYLLGFVAREAVVRGGISVMWQLFPHGIFELPAILFSMGIGFKIGTDLLRKDINLKYNFREGLRFFAFVIFPLLLVAGIIEGILIGIVN